MKSIRVLTDAEVERLYTLDQAVHVDCLPSKQSWSELVKSGKVAAFVDEMNETHCPVVRVNITLAQARIHTGISDIDQCVQGSDLLSGIELQFMLDKKKGMAALHTDNTVVLTNVLIDVTCRVGRSDENVRLTCRSVNITPQGFIKIQEH